MSPNPRLTKAQRQWVDRFIAQHPGARQVEIRAGLSGTRTVVIEWQERLSVPWVVGATHPGRSWHYHTLNVKLNKSGAPMPTSQHVWRTTYPHCLLEGRNRSLVLASPQQFVLPIAPLLDCPPPLNPAITKPKARYKRKPHLS
ncbi:hypothetical protein [Lusitaniella coriacea]|uniref:hypothetical protein n=1 Tax=Lusitaniella coriacea TaxID=1983105 RepID=UPI003CED5951